MEKISIYYLELSKDNYTLHFKAKDRLVTMTAGSSIDVGFFDLTAGDMWRLGKMICDEAVKVGYVHKGVTLPSAVFHCDRCGWKGNSPACIYVADLLNPEENIPEMGCPECRSVMGLVIEETGK